MIGIEYTIPELQFTFAMAKQEGNEELAEKLIKELEYRIWVDSPVPPFIGGWRKEWDLKDMKTVVFIDETHDVNELRAKSRYYFTHELLYKSKKHDDEKKKQTSVQHVLAVIETAKENDIDVFV